MRARVHKCSGGRAPRFAAAAVAARIAMLNRLETSARSQPSPVAFGISQRELDERTGLIEVEGELDLSTAPRLKWMLLDALQVGHSRVIVDLSRTTFMDSTALGVLVAVKRRLGSGERLVVVCPRSDVLQIFEFAGMDGAFAIFPVLEEALASAPGNAADPS
jgi:anti-sigma B factor antagonist